MKGPIERLMSILIEDELNIVRASDRNRWVLGSCLLALSRGSRERGKEDQGLEVEGENQGTGSQTERCQGTSDLNSQTCQITVATA